MLFNQSKFAGIIGCSQQNVSKMIKKGILTLENKKIDKDKGLQQLRDHNLLDENDKLKKERTKKEVVSTTQSLPFEGDTGYETVADLSTEDRKKYDEEQKQLFEELEKKSNEAKSKSINIKDVEELMSLSTYADSKAHREKFLAKLAELDFKIKKGEYILRADAESTSFEAARMIRDALLNYPSKIALRVVGKTDIKDIEYELEKEIQTILGNLSNES